MNRKLFSIVLSTLLVALTLLPINTVAQQPNNTWDACRLGAFSTEEDFKMQKSEPYDGNPYISDGDVLSIDGKICARNADLLGAFYATARAPDLGLDALDILDVGDRLAAFSTELDDAARRFTAGDLLFTTGAALPNVALVASFNINYDIGLDAIQFIGSRDNILKFVNSLSNTPRDVFLENPAQLAALLKENNIDLWFSIEGTSDAGDKPPILDGDLLSAATGTVIAANSALLPGSVPAGIPARGVDFGLDAVVVPNRTPMQDRLLEDVQFSTELLFASDKFSFTDGDVLLFGDGILTPNALLINKFGPAADFLGLDALSGAQPLDKPEPMITLIGNRSVWDIDGGFVSIGGAGTGLYWDGLSTSGPVPPRQPFGWYIPIDGYLSDDIVEFRVAFRLAGTSAPVPGTASAIQTPWRIREWYATPPYCRPTGTFDPDSDGWFDAVDYRFYRAGGGGCPNSGFVLAVWDTLNDPNVADKDGHYVIWLEWRTAPAGPIFREPVDHHVQLDNSAPTLNTLELRTPGGTVVQPCGGASAGTDILHVYGDFHDDYLRGYRLRLRGGNPPASKYYPSSSSWHNYWEGAPYATNLDEQGTTPAGLQFLREINMKDLGASYVECCYVLDLWISDAAIRHNFNRFQAYPDQPGWAWPNDFLTFAAAPAP